MIESDWITFIYSIMKIGVSGHQEIYSEQVARWIKTVVERELMSRHAMYGISCLAIGTDQLFAAIIVEKKLNLEVVIPCHEYELVFQASTEVDSYNKFKRVAVKEHWLNYHQPSQEAYLRAGERVVDLSDVMIFVWNGNPPEGLGGTADIVAYANDCKKPYIHINPYTQTVKKKEFHEI